jgi:catechol 2,3-dioxygenase-like lactoylglutathione lyase family enzyme
VRSVKLAYSALLVRDYDEAIGFYCGAMGFASVEDSDIGKGNRWDLIEPD